jgi:hypothetical protein
VWNLSLHKFLSHNASNFGMALAGLNGVAETAVCKLKEHVPETTTRQTVVSWRTLMLKRNL